MLIVLENTREPIMGYWLDIQNTNFVNPGNLHFESKILHFLSKIKKFTERSIYCIRNRYGDFETATPKTQYSVRVRKKTEQEKLRIRTLFTQCSLRYYDSLALPTLACSKLTIETLE